MNYFHRRIWLRMPKLLGYAGSWASFGAMAGLLVASLVTLVIGYLVTAYPELEKIIWRIPFILALLGSSIGLCCIFQKAWNILSTILSIQNLNLAVYFNSLSDTFWITSSKQSMYWY